MTDEVTELVAAPPTRRGYVWPVRVWSDIECAGSVYQWEIDVGRIAPADVERIRREWTWKWNTWVHPRMLVMPAAVEDAERFVAGSKMRWQGGWPTMCYHCRKAGTPREWGDPACQHDAHDVEEFRERLAAYWREQWNAALIAEHKASEFPDEPIIGLSVSP